jgi:hypothetical protein
MALAQPLSLSAGAWRAIRDELLDGLAPGEDASLVAAWRSGQERGGTVTVFLGPEEAAALARRLDERPELAASLQ